MKQQLNIAVSLAYTGIFLLLMGAGVLKADAGTIFTELCQPDSVEVITSVNDGR